MKTNTRFGHITYSKLGIRHVTLINFCRSFKIDIAKYTHNGKVHKDVNLDENFMLFLLENKTFIKFYELDYYSNKNIEIIANKTGRKIEDINDYFNNIEYKVLPKYPYRYVSSYKIDFELGGKYDFLKYQPNHVYHGNFEFRRSQIN